MKVAEALREATRRLQRTSDTARLDAELLMGEALGVSRSDMLLRRMHDRAPESYDALIARRERHEPVAYILGHQEFLGQRFSVSPAVLIPRSDSESIVAAALEACPSPDRVLDCGVGSGALLLAILQQRPQARGIGIDCSAEALAVAGANAAALGLSDRARMLVADWRACGWADALGHFDLIVANPPYVEADAPLDPDVRDWEPAGALFAGPDGMADYRLLLPRLSGLLTPGGVAVVEIGATQADAVDKIAADSGFTCELRHDLAGRARALILRLRLGK